MKDPDGRGTAEGDTKRRHPRRNDRVAGVGPAAGTGPVGTPAKAAFDKRVSVSVVPPSRPRRRPSMVCRYGRPETGPGTADQAAPDDKKAAPCYAAFSGRLPEANALPFGVRPTTRKAPPADPMSSSKASSGVTVRLDRFNQSPDATLITAIAAIVTTLALQQP